MSQLEVAVWLLVGQDDTVTSLQSASSTRVQIAGALAIMGSVFLPWFATRGPTSTSAPALSHLSAAPWVIVVLTGICLGALARSRRSASLAPRYVAAGAASLLLVVPSITMVLLDIAALWISPNFLPRTWRRVLIGVSPAAGTWLAILGGALLAVAVLERSDTLERTIQSIATGIVHFRRESLGAVLAVASVIALFDLRYQPWFSLSFSALHGTPQTISLPGYAIPIIGLAGLMLAMIAAGATIAGALRPHPLVGGLLVTLGWLSAAPAAIAAALGSKRATFHLSVPPALRQSLAQWSTAAHRDSQGYVSLPTLARHLEASIGGASGALLTALASIGLSCAGIMLVKPGKRKGSS